MKTINKFRLLITYANGYVQERRFNYYTNAIEFARKSISYTGARIHRVELSVPPEHTLRALWDHTWDAASQAAGLKDSK
jgi:hypothetical protein